MTTSRRYTLITPRADRAGPSNVAVDIGRAAVHAGWEVRLLFLSGQPRRDDFDGFAEVRAWRWRDVWSLDGVIHTHCLRPDLVGWLFTWNRRCTVLTTLHNYFLLDLMFDRPHWLVRLSWAVWSRALRRFDRRVCISTAMNRYYRRLLPKLRFDVAYNFRGEADVAAAKPPAAFGNWLAAQRASQRLVLVFVGVLNARKNVLALLTALADQPDIALVICGRGPEAERVQSRAAEATLVGRVLLAGQVPDPAQLVACCDVLVLPSLAEGLPLVVLEAARVGRPSLMSNIAVHRELAAFGLGATFDHRRFGDFSEKARTLAHGHPHPPDPTLQSIWRQQFSSEPGFRRYAHLLPNAHG